MRKNNKKRAVTVILVAVLLLLAWLCRLRRAGDIRGWVRCIIQCGLLFAWGVSVRRRIISPKVRGYLLAIVALYIFWLLDRTVKYTLLNGFTTLTRYAWYLYYIPQLLSAVFLLLCAFCLRECEAYKLPKRSRLLFLPNIAGIALVLSNDLHQRVFAFPNGIPNAGDVYSYGALYYVVMALYFSEIVAFFCILIKKCRLSGKNILLLPLLPVFLLIVYGVVYVTDYDLLAVPLGDMTAVNCCLAVLSMEACISKGLIPSNTHYEELFLSAMVSAQITDSAYNTLLSSTEAEIPTDIKKKTQAAPVMLSGNIRLSGMPLKNGYVLWTEDLSALVELVAQLEELDEDLAEKHTVLQEEYETSHRRRSLVEKNRLYNQIQNQTKASLDKLSERIEALKRAQDTAALLPITAQLAVITAYLKRRSNLIFIAEENGTVHACELSYCLTESLQSLRLLGADCEMAVHMEQALSLAAAGALYDAFETVVECTMDGLQELFAVVSLQKGRPTLCMSVVCRAELTALCAQGFSVVCEDENEWTVEYCFTKGGETT